MTRHGTHALYASILAMSRTTVIVLVALGATFAGFALASSAKRLTGSDPQIESSVAAGPQTVDVTWREAYGPAGQQLVFEVDRIEVTASGWNARIGITNDSSVGWELAPDATPDGSFGLALFETGDAKELDVRNRAGTLPAIRTATNYVPDLPRILEPGASWDGQISARGPLVAGSWVRVVFGTLVAVGNPPEEMNDTVVWITDHAVELQQ
jgi:hypothetical protein